jgi:hypothetical protein
MIDDFENCNELNRKGTAFLEQNGHYQSMYVFQFIVSRRVDSESPCPNDRQFS